MIKRVLPVLILCTLPFGLFAQAYTYTFKYHPQLHILNMQKDTIPDPFTGGLDNPQFGNIDLDFDGVQDLFVFERQSAKVLTFLSKNGKLMYAPQYEQSFPKLYDWVSVIDYNCDGKADLFTNTDDASVPEGGLVYPNGIRYLKNTGSSQTGLSFKQPKNQVFASMRNELSNVFINPDDYPYIGDLDSDGDIDILTFPGQSNLLSFYRNEGKNTYGNCDSMKYKLVDEEWGFIRYLVNSNAFVLGDSLPHYTAYKKHAGTTIQLYDFDNDGDKDLIYGDIGFNYLLYLENGKEKNSLHIDSIIHVDTIFPRNTVPGIINSWPAAYIADVNADSKPELIITTNARAATKNVNQILLYSMTPGKPASFTYQKNNFLQDQTIDFGGRCDPEFGDIDGDGDMDLLVATSWDYDRTKNNHDRLILFLNTGNASKMQLQLVDTDFLNLSAYTLLYSISPTLGDLNGDSKPDLIFGDFNGNTHYFRNTSNGGTISFAKESDAFCSMYCGVFNTPELYDLNKDGLLDIVSGRKNGTIVYFENHGTTTLPSFNAKPDIDSLGGIKSGSYYVVSNITYYNDGYSSIDIADLNKDGNPELIVGNTEGTLTAYSGVSTNKAGIVKKLNLFYSDADNQKSYTDFNLGLSLNPALADMNGDSIPDLLLGNIRGGFKAFTTYVGKFESVNEATIPSAHFVIYPNPTQHDFIIQCPTEHLPDRIQLSDLSGRIRSIESEPIHANQIRIPVSDLPSGMYILRIEQLGQAYFYRVLIQPN